MTTSQFWRKNWNLRAKAIRLGEDVMPCDIRELCENIKSFYSLKDIDKDIVVKSLFEGCGDFSIGENDLTYYSNCFAS